MASNVFQTLSVIRGSRRYNTWLYERISRHLSGRVVDIGSGLGDIARQFTNPSIEEVVLSDYADEMIHALEQAQLPLKQYKVLKLDITDPAVINSHPPRYADAVTCINVLEHISDDVAALRHMRHLLKPQGKLIIFVPALPAIYGTLDVHVDHYRRYTKRSLRAVFEHAGLKVEEAYYMNMFGIFTWFLAGRVLKQKQFHSKACIMLDRIVPVLKAMEHLGPPPLGQSLIMVGRAT